ncbi:MAG TPA: phosphatidylserine decarboxylase family protein [Blastocatellia bacterium]|nr:phosphatidylserine decarboxylase family protein [Blastocatellia bacterium]
MVARDGYPVLLAGVGLTSLFYALDFPWIALVFLLGTGFVAWFFRDPERPIPADEAAIVSPADGKVVRIASLDPSNPRAGRILSIFLSPLDVHVNRSPIAGRITDVQHHPGSFRPAMKDEASVVNEQTVITISGEKTEVIVKQIAGILARRIVCWKRVGETVQKGERIGLIKFGSRADVILSPDTEIVVRPGDRVRAGSSIIARIQS